MYPLRSPSTPLSVTGHPFDTVKVRLQTQPTPKPGEIPHVSCAASPAIPPQFRGTFDCFAKTWNAEGVRGLYKGVTSPLMGVTLMNAAAFLSYGQAKRFIRWTTNDESVGQVSAVQALGAGAIAGACIAMVEGPTDLFKTKLQTQYLAGGEIQYKGVLDCASKIARTHGIRGVYQGLGPTLLRDIPANGLYFGVYEWMRIKFGKGNPTAALTFVAGGMGGIAYWGITFPADVIKSRMQADSSLRSERRFKNIIDAARQIWREVGMRAFFRGFAPCMLRSFPSNAATFLAYDLTRQALTKN